MQILVLGPEGPDRSALENTVAALGYRVAGCDAHAYRTASSRGDMVMLDLRGDDSDWREVTETLRTDERPMMIVSERPRRLVRTLYGRPGGTMLLTGAESDAGYKVALTVCQALRESTLARAEAKAPHTSTRIGVV